MRLASDVHRISLRRLSAQELLIYNIFSPFQQISDVRQAQLEFEGFHEIPYLSKGGELRAKKYAQSPQPGWQAFSAFCDFGAGGAEELHLQYASEGRS